MSQISPSMRVVLVAAIVMLAAWFAVLKPKPETTPAVSPASTTGAAAAEPQSAAGKFKAKAEAGKATAEADAQGAANAGIDGEAPTTAAPSAQAPVGSATGTTATTTTATPSRVTPVTRLTPQAAAKLPRDVRDALERREVLVLAVLDEAALPWAPMADDDRLVRRELRKVDPVRGEVVVHTVALAEISRFDGLIKALDVTQSPTVVVVDRNRHGVALEGYVDHVTIDQAVADARRASTQRRIEAAYLRATNETCANMSVTFTRLSMPTVRGGEGRWVKRLSSAQARYGRAFGRIAAPRRWRGLRRQIVSAVEAGSSRLARAERAKDAGQIRAAVAAPRDRPLGGPELEQRFTAAGLTSCSAKRRR